LLPLTFTSHDADISLKYILILTGETSHELNHTIFT
jgi:hypothetical protein